MKKEDGYRMKIDRDPELSAAVKESDCQVQAYIDALEEEVIDLTVRNVALRFRLAEVGAGRFVSGASPSLSQAAAEATGFQPDAPQLFPTPPPSRHREKGSVRAAEQ